MRTCDFNFELPDELIAQQPCEQRTDSRLLHLTRQPGTTGTIEHLRFKQLPELIDNNDLLVFNDTRVIPARLFGRKSSGGKVEILLERLIDDRRCLAMLRASKTPRPGTVIHIESENGPAYDIEVEAREHDLFIITCPPSNSFTEIMQRAGHMPLPPYIARDDNEIDFERYQTVYSKKPGAVAAPTAGLHFDNALLSQLEDKGITSSYVTLHVGAGTFQPVRSENIEDHRMHTEYVEVSEQTVDLCHQARARGGRIVAVGTTSVRALETAAAGGQLEAFTGESGIFIYPGYEFRSADAMITNFHLPQSTLLMLVSAFAGRESILKAYQQAVTERYRFFSYGDAMLID